jgi:predicted nucleic acid-binding protein
LIRVVADANVFVSAALGRSPESPSVRIITAALDGRIELVMSSALLAEGADVLSRPRIRRRLSTEDAELFLADIAAQVDALAAVLIAADVADTIGLAGGSPDGAAVEDPSQTLHRRWRQLYLDRDRPAVRTDADEVRAVTGLVIALPSLQKISTDHVSHASSSRPPNQSRSESATTRSAAHEARVPQRQSRRARRARRERRWRDSRDRPRRGGVR